MLLTLPHLPHSLCAPAPRTPFVGVLGILLKFLYPISHSSFLCRGRYSAHWLGPGEEVHVIFQCYCFCITPASVSAHVLVFGISREASYDRQPGAALGLAVQAWWELGLSRVQTLPFPLPSRFPISLHPHLSSALVQFQARTAY